MASANEIQNEINKSGTTFDIKRKECIKNISDHTGRNTVSYYSGWLQKTDPQFYNAVSIQDNDMNGFMSSFKGLDTKKGLDLILHTPGGAVAATEAIIKYIKLKFADIRIIIPQLAMSGGTMIACIGKEIIMGNHSSLGPVDPQFNGRAAHGVVDEFEKAHKEIKEDPSKLSVWQFVLSKYEPTFVGECFNAIEWSKQILKDNLEITIKDKKKRDKIIKELTDHSVSLSHGRHLDKNKCKEIGLNIIDLEKDDKLQDLILSYHHTTMLTFNSTSAIKIIENNIGNSMVWQISKQ